jgi:hypothetical protein
MYDNDAAMFRQRFERLGFKQTELAILINRGPRSVSYYLNGGRPVPPAIWVRLSEVENMPREKLLQTIVAAQRRKQRQVDSRK